MENKQISKAKRRRVFICYPSISGRPVLESLHSVWASITNCQHSCMLYYATQESLVSRMRNIALANFIESDCEIFISVDDDIVIHNPPQGESNFINILVNDLEKVDFSGYLYSLKKPGSFHPASIFDGSEKEIGFNAGLKKMKYLSAGGWAIKRSVVQKVVDAHPELQYDGEDANIGKKFYDICGPRIVDMTAEESGLGKPFRKLLSEDWIFCHHVNQLGIQIYANTAILTSHVGKFDNFLWIPQSAPDQAPSVMSPDEVDKILSPKPTLSKGIAEAIKDARTS